jgi:DNA ligase (NAD+)
MFLSDQRNIKILNELDKLGVWPQAVVLDQNASIFAGKTFVITGTLDKGREEYKKIIENCGGKISSSVSKKTSYLLCGEAAGSKLDDAKKHNVTILSSEDFENLMTEMSQKNNFPKP